MTPLHGGRSDKKTKCTFVLTMPSPKAWHNKTPEASSGMCKNGPPPTMVSCFRQLRIVQRRKRFTKIGGPGGKALHKGLSKSHRNPTNRQPPSSPFRRRWSYNVPRKLREPRKSHQGRTRPPLVWSHNRKAIGVAPKTSSLEAETGNNSRFRQSRRRTIAYQGGPKPPC